MIKYYTRACNFYYGKQSKNLIKKGLTLPLNGNKEISFDNIEIFIKKKNLVSSKIINLSQIKLQEKNLKQKIEYDLKRIVSKKKLPINKSHILMGILNLTPDSFSDGGKFNSFRKALNQIENMIDYGADIIDVGGESTRPGSKIIPSKLEWQRVEKIIKKFKKKYSKTLLSIDTRKSLVMKNSLRFKADIINDVSCFKFDKNSYKSIKNKNVWKILHHMKGTPQTMQNNPKYNNVLLEIYDFFENQIKKFKKDHYPRKFILDPGIGFGKNLKHNLMILNKISLFHSLGFPILIGTSRKRFINQIAGKFDTKERIGGTLSSVLYSLSQGVNIFRVHNVSEVKQGIMVYENLLNK